ncbi:MAG: hypothetical protein V3S41_00290 [Spirochaetia bacterium]
MRRTRNRNLLFLTTAAAVLAVMSAGCTSSPETPVQAADVYTGAGRGESLGAAMNAAKMDAVRKAVIDMIGSQAEAANAEALDELLYSTRNPNAFVYNDTLETTRKDGSLIDGDMVYELTIRVNVSAVRRTLEANGIIGDPSSSPVDEPSAAGDWDEVTPEEERFIRRYVETMTYMVYFSNDAAVGAGGVSADNAEFIMQSAVNQANSYLVADGRVVVDAAQVARLKEDQQLIYEEETGREISLLQWVARRLNADVYIELDAQVSGTTSAENHYGTADVTLNMYDTSTAQVLGSVNRRSQNSFSRTSQQDAMLNAVQSTVYQAMPYAVEMARNQMARMLTRGIRYELTIQNPPDGRALSRFRSTMRENVREIATVSQSPEEAVYEVFVIGSTDDVVDLVYEVSERVAGFEDLVLVISRGRAMTFDAGF